MALDRTRVARASRPARRGVYRLGKLGVRVAWLLAVTLCSCSDDLEYRRGPALSAATPADVPDRTPESQATSVGSHAAFPSEFGPYVDPPQGAEHYVYVLYPDGDSIAVIKAGGGGLATLRTGIHPSYLKVVPGTDDAVVLNTGSDEASLVRIDAEGELGASNVSVIPGANYLVIAPDGRHAIAYFDAARLPSGEPFGDFQSVSLLDLSGSKLRGVTVSVGFKPRAVFFQGDNQRAFVVTEAAISIIELDAMVDGGGGVAPSVGLSLQATVPEDVRVSVGQSGEYALLHDAGSSQLLLLTLADGSLQALEVADYFRVNEAGEPDVNGKLLANAHISGVALTEDGKFAVAAVSAQDAVVRIPIPEGFADPTLGRVARTSTLSAGRVAVVPNSDLVIAYPSSDQQSVEKAAVVDFSSDTPVARDYALRKGVRSVWISPKGTVACIIHSKADGSPYEEGLTLDAQIDRSQGYTLLRPDLEDVQKLQLTVARPKAIAATPGDEYLFIIFNMPSADVREIQRVDVNSLGVDVPLVLDSLPTAVGALGATQTIFVNQDHPDGRITFIDWPEGETTTVTGFELNSRIRN
ncbi:MAG: hypothetical protein JW940_01725 [Polyangiaceae bacterium]|nr:hypothetical protein [Polyangiaceae bacterium]